MYSSWFGMLICVFPFSLIIPGWPVLRRGSSRPYLNSLAIFSTRSFFYGHQHVLLSPTSKADGYAAGLRSTMVGGWPSWPLLLSPAKKKHMSAGEVPYLLVLLVNLFFYFLFVEIYFFSFSWLLIGCKIMICYYMHHYHALTVGQMTQLHCLQEAST